MEQQVLQKGLVDSLFVFGKWTENGGVETHLKYLGEVKTKHGPGYRIMSYIWIAGQSRGVTTKILIFNSANRYIGSYQLGVIYDLPDKLENGRLIFTNKGDKDCNGKRTDVDFSKALPKDFFVDCQGGYGSTFKFISE